MKKADSDAIDDMNSPKVSVLIPAYNCSSYVKQAVVSMLNQTHSNLEILIADDGSTDNTKAIIDAINDPRITRLHNHENMGYIKTSNKLFAHATGDLITSLDADDHADAQRIELQLKAFQADPLLHACGTNCFHFLDDGEVVSISNFRLNGFHITKDDLSPIYQFCTATIMIRKEVYDKIGGYRDFFDASYGNADVDWVCRIMENYKMINIKEPLYYYRTNPRSASMTLTSPGQLFSCKIVEYLAKQRLEHQTDSLMTGDTKDLEDHIQELNAPYKNDPALIFRINASNNLYHKQHSLAIKSSWSAIKAAPTKFINYRTLFYCIRWPR